MMVSEMFIWITKIATVYNLVVSLPLYILVLVSISKKRRTPPYDSTYFIIFMALGCVDIMGFLIFQIRKFVTWEWNFILFLFVPFNQATVSARIVSILIWFIGFMQYTYTLFMQFNRYICILFPSLYDKIGTRKITYIIILIICCLCFLGALPIWYANCQVQELKFYLNDSDLDNFIIIYNGPTFIDGEYLRAYYWVWKSFIYLIVATGVVFYPLILLKLNRQLKRNFQNKQQIVFSLKVMYSACILFLANLMFFAVFIVRDNLLLPDPNLKYVYGIMLDLTSDFYYMYNAYSIMITSNEIRLAVKKILFVGAASAVHVHPKINLSPNNNVVQQIFIGCVSQTLEHEHLWRAVPPNCTFSFLASIGTKDYIQDVNPENKEQNGFIYSSNYGTPELGTPDDVNLGLYNWNLTVEEPLNVTIQSSSKIMFFYSVINANLLSDAFLNISIDGVVQDSFNNISINKENNQNCSKRIQGKTLNVIYVPSKTPSRGFSFNYTAINNNNNSNVVKLNVFLLFLMSFDVILKIFKRLK